MPDSDTLLKDGLTGRYTIGRELGRGGMAIVYLADDVRNARRVALKVIRADNSDPSAAARFGREIRTAARLRHPHILPVYDSGETGGHLWYAMPYIDGESLRARLDRDGRVPLADALRITCEAADALAHAHAYGIIHRDVKPENVLVTQDGTALVADFGIARALEPGPDTGAMALTLSGYAVGTPGYMAPEHRIGAPADERSDVWSLAAVLFEMVTGTKVIAATGAPEVPPAVEAAMRRALDPDPARRCATMQEFGASLDAAMNGGRWTRWARVMRRAVAFGTP